jgi:YD repeat-containing protein
VENNPVIRNNTVTSHTSYGIYMEAQGSSDNSGSDTKVLATVENNLLVDNNTNIHLYLYPRGSDGLQHLSPVIRYNSIRNGSDGIVVDDAQNYDTLNPTISYNHFDGHSSYAIENQTGRTITANENYWGGDTAAWDVGPQSGDTSGNVTTSSYLTSSHPPVLSRLSPGQATAGVAVTLHGANLDDGLQTTVIQYNYDPLYRLTQATYSGILSGTYAYEYDAVGNRLAYNTNITTTQSITYAYNAANQLVESVELGGETTTYEWDKAGRLITTTVGANVTRIYTYSQDGNLTAALVDGLLTTFVYDGDGRRLQMSVGGEVTTYTVDYAGGFRVLLEEGGAFSDTKHYLYGLECIAELVDAGEPDSE